MRLHFIHSFHISGADDLQRCHYGLISSEIHRFLLEIIIVEFFDWSRWIYRNFPYKVHVKHFEIKLYLIRLS